MILCTGDEIRLHDPHRHKFADAMSEYLWVLSMDSGWDDQYGDVEAPTGWVARFGKRVLVTTSSGHVFHARYKNEAQAVAECDKNRAIYDEWEGDDE